MENSKCFICGKTTETAFYPPTSGIQRTDPYKIQICHSENCQKQAYGFVIKELKKTLKI